MPNTFVTPSVMAASALATLYNILVVAQLVNRDYDEDFTGKQGDTITVRKPATFEAKEFDRNTGIELQTVNESSFTVELDTLLDVSFPVTTEELTLEIDAFDERLLNPAMEAIAQDVDGRLAEELADLARSAGQLADGSSSQRRAFTGARAILTRNKLPLSNRSTILSPEAVADVFDDDLFVRADARGDTDGLREAAVGRKFAFDHYETQVIGEGSGTKGEVDGVGFHRDAVALVSRTLVAPEGVAASQVATQGYKGLGLRVVKAYDINKKQDVVSIDTLIGVKELREDAAVELEFAQGS